MSLHPSEAPGGGGLMRIFWPTDLQRPYPTPAASPLATSSSAGQEDQVSRGARPGVVVGWRNSPLDLFAVAVLEGVSAQAVEAALAVSSSYRSSSATSPDPLLLQSAPHPVSRIYQLCGQPGMHVLGFATTAAAAAAGKAPEPEPPPPPPPPPQDQSQSLDRRDWVRVVLPPTRWGRTGTAASTHRPPRVSCPGASSVQVILFERPHPGRMQYFSLDPILLALGDEDGGVRGAGGAAPPPATTTTTTGADAGSGSADDLEVAEEREERRRKERKGRLVAKLRGHAVVQHTPSQKEQALARIVNQANWAWELERLLQANVWRVVDAEAAAAAAAAVAANSTARPATRPKRSLSVSERVVESAAQVKEVATSVAWGATTRWLLPLVQATFVVGLMCHRVAAEALLLVLEWRPDLGPGRNGRVGKAIDDGPDHPQQQQQQRRAALKDISATAQQVEVRLQQFCYWPMQYVTLRQRKEDWESVTTSHPDYIRFYNSLWLVANDVIIGIAVGSYIIDNADWVAHQINGLLTVYTVEALQRSISWLMGWPAGLKLNNELARFLGDLFLWVIEYWSIGCIETLRPAWPHIIWFIGFSSFAGASMPIALFSDLLSFLTIHIYSFYLASARIFHWQLTILISLFHLFRGKKHNVLRNRIDSCDYDLDQLLVGTILFTLLFFLLPTVVVFYLNFAIARMIIISLKAIFDTLLSCLNHFPLFALMLRIKDPRRLPGGIRFELRDTQDNKLVDSNEPPTSVIYLKPIPLTFRAMFHQYFQMASRIRKHYLSPLVLLCLLTGKFVPPIDRKNLYSLQYSMLPARRAGILDMWNALASLRSGDAAGGWWGGSSKNKPRTSTQGRPTGRGPFANDIAGGNGLRSRKGPASSRPPPPVSMANGHSSSPRAAGGGGGTGGGGGGRYGPYSLPPPQSTDSQRGSNGGANGARNGEKKL